MRDKFHEECGKLAEKEKLRGLLNSAETLWDSAKDQITKDQPPTKLDDLYKEMVNISRAIYFLSKER